MKVIVSLAIIILASINIANAQEVFFNSYIEQTSVSPKVGGQLGYEFSYGYEVGVFYQKEVNMLGSSDTPKPRFREEEFVGILLAAPILMADRYNVKLNARTGMRNQFNFAISPSVVGNYKLINTIQVQLGVGIRALRPTFQAGLRINL